MDQYSAQYVCIKCKTVCTLKNTDAVVCMNCRRRIFHKVKVDATIVLQAR